MSLGTSNRDGGKTSESGHLRALGKIVSGDVITGLNVVQRAAGVNMSVDVQVGDAFVRRSDDTYAHPVFNDAVYNQVISAADGSNPRRDIVVIYVDYGQTPSTAVSNNTNGVVKIKVVNGTPAGSPVDPNGAAIQSSVGAGNPYSILARVRVPAGQTSISNSLIDDLRTMISNNATTINTAAIIDAAVTAAKIATAAVTAPKIDFTTLLLAKIVTATTGANYNSSTYTDITQLGSTNITVPTTGKILVMGVFTISNQVANTPDNFVQVLAGATASRSAKVTTNGQFVGSNMVLIDTITGLTPGATVAIKAQYKNSTSTNVYIDTQACSIFVYAN